MNSDFKKKILDKENYFSFIHVADTHNGYKGNASKYNEYASLRIDKTTENGINILQHDIDKAFEEIIDLALTIKVDAVLHAGDGWDSVTFPDRIVDNTYTKQVTRLFSEGIDYVEIVGNHNFPKKAGKGCFLESLGRYPKVKTAYKGIYEKFSLKNDKVLIHCVPSTFNQEILNQSLDKIYENKDDSKINVGLGHFGLTNIKFYAENAQNNLLTTLDKLVSFELDYFALGDYHPAQTFTERIRYSGSIIRMRISDVDNQPQVFVVCINLKTKEIEVVPYYLKSRNMFDLPFIDAENKTIEQINNEIISALSKNDLTDAIVRLRILKLPLHLKHHLDIEKIEELTSSALFLKLELKEKKEDSITIRDTEEVEFENILDGWNSYMNKIEDDGTFDKEYLREKGLKELKAITEG